MIRNHDCAPACVNVWISLLQAARDGAHLCLCLLQCNAGVQARYHKAIVVAANRALPGAPGGRHPQACPSWQAKPVWHDADDGVALAIESKVATHHSGITAKMAL